MKHRLALAVVLGLLAAAGHAQASPEDFSAMPIDKLKTTYLACDRAATRTVLDSTTAARCSLSSEELLKRGFGGDFERLLAWWRTEKESEAARIQAAAPRS